MKKFNIKVNGNAYSVEVEEVGALLFQGFASQQQTAVILHHSLAVAINIMQR